MTNSLLPPNATLLERALEAGAARIVDVSVPIDIDDPMTCPVELLPWLAWGLSVDTWDADWSEADKRAAVAGSIALHRRKGTRMSVEQVLARFDALASIVEWHEAVPRRAPHTFEVLLPIGVEGGLRTTAAFAESVIREVGRVKPLREHFRLVQMIDAAGFIGIQGAARAAIAARADLTFATDTTRDWSIVLQTQDGEPITDDTGAYLEMPS